MSESFLTEVLELANSKQVVVKCDCGWTSPEMTNSQAQNVRWRHEKNHLSK